MSSLESSLREFISRYLFVFGAARMKPMADEGRVRSGCVLRDIFGSDLCFSEPLLNLAPFAPFEGRVHTYPCTRTRLASKLPLMLLPTPNSMPTLTLNMDHSKYKAYDPAGNEIYLPVLSDWDLDAAFLRIHNISIQTSTEPCLTLQMDIKPHTSVKECDSNCATTPNTLSNSGNTAATAMAGSSAARDLMSPLQQSLGASQKYMQQMQNKLPGLIMNQMAAIPPRPPLCDGEFRMFLDALGQIQRSDELRKVIFFGGIDPSLRRVVWKHILNVYPSAMNGHQRMNYMRRKSEYYYKLRDTWKAGVKNGCMATGELAYVTSMVKKDVLRTDRLHPFYAGNDDNQNIASLFNILTTYALNHPSVSYCQGMSDIASPLLVTMNDEAQAYICFCAIMSRVKGNFMLNGIAMTQKFAHLTEALSYYDAEFWEYLKSQQADDLLFCYRWLLLEMKREFPFEDALRMLEVQWSSLKYDTCALDKELKLYEKEFVPTLHSPLVSPVSSMSPSYFLAKPRENAYTKVCDLRRQSSSVSLNALNSSMGKLETTKRLNHSLDDNATRYTLRRQKRASTKSHQSLDESKIMQLMQGADDKTTQSHENRLFAEATVLDSNSDDDNVFIEESGFKFHDTNPFKDALNCSSSAGKENENNVNMKDFLSGSSSPTVSENSISEHSELSCGITNGAASQQIPKGIAKLQNKNILSNYNAVSNIIAKQLAHASIVSENVRRVGSSGGSHFKDLKEKIAATSRRGLTLDDGCNSFINEKAQQKLVKNFNEFLSFTTINKSRVANKETIAPSNSTIRYDVKETAFVGDQITQQSFIIHPLVQLSKEDFASSLDDSDSLSLPDTTNNTCSCSTAATAIQQKNNLSSNSLHLEINSLSSLGHTPDRSPVSLRKPRMEAAKCNNKGDGIQPDPNESNAITPDDSQDLDYYPMTTAITQELDLEAKNLDRHVFGDLSVNDKNVKSCGEIEYEKLGKDSLDIDDDFKANDVNAFQCKNVEKERRSNEQVNGNVQINEQKNPHAKVFASNPFFDEDIFTEGSNALVAENNSYNNQHLPEVLLPISTDANELVVTTTVELATTAAEEEITFPKPAHNSNALDPIVVKLPAPSDFGGGNPFLIFLCLTLLLQHRNTIMKNNMDYNEIAMHFDKMVRKHDVTRVLNQARRMYIEYLKTQASFKQQQNAAASNPRTSDVNKNATAKRSQSHEESNIYSSNVFTKS
uniref:Rab-GAP TBC domain-containing protein n=1 Tax=Glossina palpalis gambiensis TaxID=67801 RepID=A0A1B0ARI8_9MUSC